MTPKLKILFTGGGTGGHLMPIIAVAREIKKISPDTELEYIGTKGDFELLLNEDFKLHSILGGKLRRYFSLLNLVDILFKIPLSFLQSFFLLLFIRPDLIFSKGGTGSLPVTYCARLLRVPVFIHESDMTPGLSNKIASKWAKKIFISFDKTEYFDPRKTILTGNPIRKELLGGNIEDAKKALNISSKKPVILILGGSQGSETINDFILLVLNDLLRKYEVIHVTGLKKYKKFSIESRLILQDKALLAQYHLYSFLDEVQLKNAYSISSVIVSRSGSGSIFEIAAAGKPSILIPLPTSAKDHQSKNAYQYARSGAAIVIEQGGLSQNFFMGEIDNVLSRTEKMRAEALKFAKPEAAEIIAKEILKYLHD